MTDGGPGFGVGMPLPRRTAAAPQPHPRPKRRWLRRAALWVVLATAAWLFVVFPPPLWYRFVSPRETAFMALRDREASRAGEPPISRRYTPVALAQVAPAMRRAVLIAEDHRFEDHAGFDWIEIRRAVGYPRDSFHLGSARHRRDLWRAVVRTWQGQGRVRGASTITQQVAKNLYLSPSRNPLRKVKEAILAKRLEWMLPKDRILELYLNIAEFGPGIWGVEAASREYFGKPASRLSRTEAAALAATLPFPLLSNPAYRPARMRARQATILRRM